MPDRTGEPRVAYFTMEIGLTPEIPIYAGGLGVLAGDTARSAADLGIPMAVVTLVHHQGYFRQRLSPDGEQTEGPSPWPVDQILEPLPQRVKVELDGRQVRLRAWRLLLEGTTGRKVPVYLLDSRLPENAEPDRCLTDELYGGDKTHRLRQEALLGIGGVRMLRALGHDSIECFHLNEGHAALLTVALIEEFRTRNSGPGDPGFPARLAAVRERCVFTTHTPVPAGHDRFPAAAVEEVLGTERRALLRSLGQEDELDMTDVALRCSRYVNGVAMRHGQVSQAMFPGYSVHAITNGVHAATWAASPIQSLFDRHLSGWRVDPFALRYAVSIPPAEMWAAHEAANKDLVDFVNARTAAGFRPGVLTLVFARRATEYKRPALIFGDLDRIKAMARFVGPLQMVFAGRAHPHDREGKEMIRRVFELGARLKGRVPVAFLENYDMAIAKVLCAGGDVWLNTPRPPMEASGTSGMKAAVNGVPSLSVLDGWWIEGHVEGVTGWAIGENVTGAEDPSSDQRFMNALYDKLSKSVMPCYYRDRNRFISLMRNAIALNGSYFNTHRMLSQYLTHAYRLAG